MLSNVASLPDVRVPCADDLPAVVAALLRGEDGEADPRQVGRLTDYLRAHGADPRHMRTVTLPGGRAAFAAAAVAAAGGMCLLLCPGDLGEAPPVAARAAVAAAVASATAADPSVRLVQALRPTEHDPLDPILHALGFRHLADLLYLARRVQRPPRESETRPPDRTSVVTYAAATHDLFARAIEASYVGSLDCPAMHALRTIDEVIAAHKGAGAFRPDWWQVLVADGAPTEPLGVLLLAGTPDGGGTEIVYLGLSPAARGRGLAAWLVRRAMAVAGAAPGKLLTLAVDARNVPAQRLYERCNFRRVHGRRVMVRIVDER